MYNRLSYMIELLAVLLLLDPPPPLPPLLSLQIIIRGSRFQHKETCSPSKTFEVTTTAPPELFGIP